MTERSKTLAIRHDDRLIPCAAGDSVAAALLDAGICWLRETQFGERRGLFCGMGVCGECLVTIDGIANQRACITLVRDGMVVESGRGLPSLAGAAPAPAPAPEIELAPDVLVVGGGPAGLSAAAAAAETGAAVILIDERPKLGGQYYKQPSEGMEIGTSDPQYARGRDLIERVRRADVSVFHGTQVWAAFGRQRILATSPDGMLVLRPDRLILAPGAYERGVPMPGWTLPGFMTTGAVQTLLRAYGVPPGARVIVSGNGPLNIQVAAELVHAGVTVVALAELSRLASLTNVVNALRMTAADPGLAWDGGGYVRTLVRTRVPIFLGSSVMSARGDGRVEQATVMRIDAGGFPIEGTARTFDVDTVCAGFGFLPSNEIARSLGCEHAFDAQRGHLVAQVDATGRSSVEGVWIVGDGAGLAGARAAQATGFLAGLDAARRSTEHLSREAIRVSRDRRRAERFQHALARLYAAPRLVDQLAQGSTVVCRCENVQLDSVEDAYSSGMIESGAVKRMTRAGMGHCQGRYCSAVLGELGARKLGCRPDERSGFAPAPPFKPLVLSALSEEVIHDVGSPD